VAQRAESLVGSLAVHYTFGRPELGQTPQDGFDCSGFVRFVLLESGISIPSYIDIGGNARPIRHANEFWDHYGVTVHEGLHRRGDLIFFSRNGLFPTHIGIVRDQENYIHSPGRSDTRVAIATIQEEAIVSRSSEFRQTFSKNPIGFKALTLPIAEQNYRYTQRVL